MRTMIGKGLLLALCLAFAPVAHVAVDAALVTAMLLAVIVSGLSEWLSGRRLAFLPVTAFCLIAVAAPDCRLFLPLVAFDMARIRMTGRRGIGGRRATPVTAGNGTGNGHGIPPIANHTDRSGLLSHPIPAIMRWLWAVPLVPTMVEARLGGDVVPAALLVASTCIGFLMGVDSRDVPTLRRALRRTEDRLRESSRSSRIRIADMDEERAQSVRMATLGERTRIARDIHDNVGHLLTRAIMQAQAGRAVAEATGDAVAAQGFGSLGATLDDAMTMVRRSVHDLEDDGTDFAAQIEDAARSFAASAGTDGGIGPERGLEVRLENDIDAAPAPVSRCLSTVIRESLANVAHHSMAREARVTLRDFPAFWQLVVSDPGPAVPSGDDADPAGAPPHGMGIADIGSRVRALGGTAYCGPYDGGWRVFVSIPKARWAADGDARKASDTGARGTSDNRGSYGGHGTREAHGKAGA
ncbi:sensor histidine kinase [Bifidobacterium platyrrhinorum]|uniref:histidine kinase n=1 Tax=Bifidobacterium platyrrhinorum TaxID=2661628 RepID=A0A6L9SUM9_9BIFI|nr:histidine kinase [Bifidobacterium platyrrhinorum]NEG55765.1 two-component sensor histidine kinase [Bifidobacterium platyrrhinorum]